jgi:hypothetical protein
MSKNEREDTTSFQTILYCAAALDLARNSYIKTPVREISRLNTGENPPYTHLW